MASVQELESMIVRLIGDGSSYQKMMTDAAKSAQDAATQIGTASKQIEGISTSMAGFATTALDLFAKLGVAITVGGAVSAFNAVEKNTIQMTAAMKQNGENVQTTMADYREFSAETARTTQLSKNATMALLKQAEAQGIIGDRAKHAVMTAVAAGAIQNTDPESQMRMAIQLEKGNTHLAKRQFNLHNVHDENILLEKIEAQRRMGLKMEDSLMESSDRKLTKLGQSLKGLSVEIGGMVSKAMLPFVDAMRDSVDWFQKQDQWVKTATEGFIGLMMAIKMGPGLYTSLSSAVISLSAPLVNTTKLLMGMSWAGFSKGLEVVEDAFMKLITSTQFATGLMIAFKVAVVAGAVYAVYQLTKAFIDSRQEVKEFNAQLQRAKFLSSEFSELAAKQTKTMLAEAGTGTIEEQRAKLQKKIDQLTEEVKGSKKNEASAQRALDEQGKENVKAWGFEGGLGFLGLGGGMTEQLQGELTQAIDKTKEWKNKLTAVKEAFGLLEMPENFKVKIDEAAKSAKEKFETAGMTAGEAHIHKLQQNKFVTDDMVAELRGWNALNEAMEKTKKTRDEVLEGYGSTANESKSMVKSMEEEIRNFALEDDAYASAADKKKILNLEMERENLLRKEAEMSLQGASVLEQEKLERDKRQIESDIENAKGMARIRREQELHKKMTEEMNASTAKLFEDAAGVTKQFETPVEKFTEKVHHLNEMFEVGALSTEVYQKAMGGAQDELDKATGAANDANAALEKLDATLSGGADAKAKIAAYREMVAATLKHAEYTRKVMPDVQAEENQRAKKKAEANAPIEAAEDARRRWAKAKEDAFFEMGATDVGGAGFDEEQIGNMVVNGIRARQLVDNQGQGEGKKTMDNVEKLLQQIRDGLKEKVGQAVLKFADL